MTDEADDAAQRRAHMATAMNVTRADAERAERILRDRCVSTHDMCRALFDLIWALDTLDEVRNATAGVGHPYFYECEFDRCVSPEVKELWPEPTSVYADLINALRGLGNDHA
jgi:hypothetical protein